MSANNEHLPDAPTERPYKYIDRINVFECMQLMGKERDGNKELGETSA